MAGTECDLCGGQPCQQYEVTYPNGDVLITNRCHQHRGALEALKNYGTVTRKRKRHTFKVSTIEDIKAQLRK